MSPSPRQLVRSAVGLAVVAPGLALLGLGVVMAFSGGSAGVLAGLVVGGLAVLVLGAALVMTHAPVSIARMLERSGDPHEDSGPEDASTNGHGPGGLRVEDDVDPEGPGGPLEREP